MFYMRKLGIGKSAGAFRDDQQGENTAKILKTTLWLRGQGPCFCKQDFSHNLSTKSHSELIPCALPFCYNLHHFDSSCTNLPERSRETGRESRAIRQEKPVISRVWRGGVRGNKFMLRMWLLDIVVIFLVLWWSRAKLMMGPIKMTLHCFNSRRAGMCYENCCMSRSLSGCRHCLGLSFDQVTRWWKSWTGSIPLLLTLSSVSQQP